ncbi:MAG: hypothetical protein WDN06_13550 [Asticcacaulis sp.]
MIRRFLLCLAVLAVLAPPADARAHRHHRVARPVLPYAATRDLAEPVQAALAAAKAGRRVIVVFDIDNTLPDHAAGPGRRRLVHLAKKQGCRFRQPDCRQHLVAGSHAHAAPPSPIRRRLSAICRRATSPSMP